MRAIYLILLNLLLSNKNNKTSIITLSSKYLEEGGQEVIQCNGDVDQQLFQPQSVFFSAKTDNPVMVVADDTDIAIMFLYHWNGEMLEIIFNSKKTETAQSIASACSNLEDKEHRLFVHACSGFNTVSATFGKGKVSFLNLVNQSDELKGLSSSIH